MTPRQNIIGPGYTLGVPWVYPPRVYPEILGIPWGGRVEVQKVCKNTGILAPWVRDAYVFIGKTSSWHPVAAPFWHGAIWVHMQATGLIWSFFRTTCPIQWKYSQSRFAMIFAGFWEPWLFFIMERAGARIPRGAMDSK